MARTFTAASSEKITFGLGALGFAFGPGTIAAIVRPASIAAAVNIVTAGAASTPGYAMRLSAAGAVQLFLDGVTGTAGPNLAAGSWYLIAAKKATGTAVTRTSVYDYAAGTMTHTSTAAGIANSTVPITRAALATNAAGTGGFFPGDIAVAAVWNVVLADQDVESLAFSLPPWVATQPKGLWLLDQAAVAQLVPDLSGGGANQSAITGTTVSANSVPIWTPYGTVTNP